MPSETVSSRKESPPRISASTPSVAGLIPVTSERKSLGPAGSAEAGAADASTTATTRATVRAMTRADDDGICSPDLRTAERRRSEEHTSELQSLMRISYAVFCLKKKKKKDERTTNNVTTPKST